MAGDPRQAGAEPARDRHATAHATQPGRSAARNAIRLVNTSPPYSLRRLHVVGFSQRKQGLHDMIAKTLVLNGRASAFRAEPAAATGPLGQLQRLSACVQRRRAPRRRRGALCLWPRQARRRHGLLAMIGGPAPPTRRIAPLQGKHRHPCSASNNALPRTSPPKPTRCGRPWIFSTAAPPCRSSRATARKPPAASTTPSCACWKSACATCASWKTAARRSWPASRNRASSPMR